MSKLLRFKYINQLSDNEIKPGQVLKIIIKAF